jgi:elongation factor P
MAQAKPGTIIVYGNKYFKVLRASHSHIGRGKANIELQLKNILTGQNLTKSFKSDENLEEVEIEKKELEFVYKKGDRLLFFEEKNAEKSNYLEFQNDLGENALFLKKGMKVVGLFNEDGNLLAVELPVKETYKVIFAPPGVKGNTVQARSKVVELESGAKISTPLFIKKGDLVVVNLETGAYVARA